MRTLTLREESYTAKASRHHLMRDIVSGLDPSSSVHVWTVPVGVVGSSVLHGDGVVHRHLQD